MSSQCRQPLIRTFKLTPFANQKTTLYQKYQSEVDNNCRMLSVKFPQQSSLKIKDLLEELDNNVEMVQEVLRNEEKKVESPGKYGNVIPVKKYQPQEQNKMLKKAITGLYEKFKLAQSKAKNYEEQNQKLKKENEFYKNRSKLLEDQLFTKDFERNVYIE